MSLHPTFDALLEKIRHKRKQTPFREFVREICSWKPITFSRNHWLVSRFPTSDRITVTSHSDFEASRDWLLQNGLPYDASIPFFEQFWKLLRSTPLMPTIAFFQNENSQYADIVHTSKNAYLSFAVIGCENVFYSESVKGGCTNVFDSFVVVDSCSDVYNSGNIYRSSRIFHSSNILDSRDIWYCVDMQGCSECIACYGLENQSYCIENIRLEPAEYSRQKIIALAKYRGATSSQKSQKNFASSHSIGVGITRSEEVTNGLNVYQLKGARNVIASGAPEGSSGFYDVLSAGGGGGDNFYGVFGWGTFADGVYCSAHINGGSTIIYSYFCQNSSFVLGCVGLKNQSYCIFNKQYTPEEWYMLAEKILASLDIGSELGAFFPPSLCPFYFNESFAFLIDGSTKKDEVIAQGFLWRDTPEKVDIPPSLKTISAADLGRFESVTSGGTLHISDEVLGYAIHDDKGQWYRIMADELTFYQRYALPLPRQHWLDRLRTQIPSLYL